jgi:hypothetical protein
MKRLLWKMFYDRWNRVVGGTSDKFDREFIPSVIGRPITHWLEDEDDCRRIHEAIEELEEGNLVHWDEIIAHFPGKCWSESPMELIVEALDELGDFKAHDKGGWDDNRYFQ